MMNNLLIAFHAFNMRMLTSLSVDEILLPKYAKWLTNLRGLSLKLEMGPSCLKYRISWFGHSFSEKWLSLKERRNDHVVSVVDFLLLPMASETERSENKARKGSSTKILLVFLMCFPARQLMNGYHRYSFPLLTITLTFFCSWCPHRTHPFRCVCFLSQLNVELQIGHSFNLKSCPDYKTPSRLGLKNIRLHLCRGVRAPPLTLNYLMMGFQ